MNGVSALAAIDLSTAMSDVTTFISSCLTLITGNWLLIFLLLAPFAIGLLVALIRSLRG